MKLLITGGTGFIGRYVMRAAVARDHVVVLYDRAEPVADLPAGVGFVRGDLSSVDEFTQTLRDVRPAAVLHLAAVVGAAASMSAPIESTRVNIESTVCVLEAAYRFGGARVVHLSSEETYGDFERDAIDEDHAQRPFTPYGVAKAAAEGFCRYYRRCRAVDVVSARTSWVYGVGLSRTRPPGSLLEHALRGEPVNHPWGADFIVDYTSVYDVADGLLQLAAAPVLAHDAYHLSSGEATYNRRLLSMIQGLVPDAKLHLGPGPWYFAPNCAAPRKGALKYDRAHAEVGYTPKFDLESGLDRYMRDLRSGERL